MTRPVRVLEGEEMEAYGFDNGKDTARPVFLDVPDETIKGAFSEHKVSIKEIRC